VRALEYKTKNMKKVNLKNKLNLTKATISKLDLRNFKGGDDLLLAGMSMIGANTVYIGCGINVFDGEHISRHKCNATAP
jgi:hypothetical protein